jgi:hypothetical protein
VRTAARLRPSGLASWPSSRADRWALWAAFGLVAVAVLVGAALGWIGHPVHAPAAPLFAWVRPHLGWGTPFAIGVAVAVIRWGPELADRLPWRRLLAYSWFASLAWTFSLAMVDGWQRGIAGRLTTEYEYLNEVPGVTDVPAMLRGFTGRILEGTPDSWTTHVAGHPPGSLLLFVGLDRIGLGGGTWAAILCVLAGCAATVAVAITLRALGDEAAARTALPFLVLFPGAVWVGVSADGLFTGVAAGSLALLAVGLTRGSRLLVTAGGAGLAVCAFLSYGLVLLILPAAAVVAVRARRLPMMLWALLGAGVVAGTMSALGFNWWDGYHLVKQRYYQGIASDRAYAYWIWGNLAALTLSAGPLAAAVLRRSAASVRTGRTPAVLLCLGAAGAVLAADLSGLSKAETERIWLPFAIWLPAAVALIPGRDRRGWLCLQAATALVINHLVVTNW